MGDKTCSNCDYWKSGNLSTHVAGKREGKCRRYPPKIVYRAIDKSGITPRILTEVVEGPTTIESYFCGEHSD